MKYVKIFIAVIVLIGAAGGAGYVVLTADQMQFKSVCEANHKRYTKKYCKNIGKEGWTQKSVIQVNEKKYGTIIGVAWRKKGSVISSRSQKNKRKSEKNAYYYIIGDIKDSKSQFLMMADQIDAR